MLKIISGGQAGVDRAALDQALEHGLEIGGWCPKDRRAEDGRIDDKYPLIETFESDYKPRTRKNITNADATLIIAQKYSQTQKGGTYLTWQICEGLSKEVLIVLLRELVEGKMGVLRYEIQMNNIKDWVGEKDVLNIAGPSEKHLPGIYLATRNFLSKVLPKNNVSPKT